LTNALVELSRKSGSLEGDIKGKNLILPTLKDDYSNKKKEFEKIFQNHFQF
jgi:hypothetical protein